MFFSLFISDNLANKGLLGSEKLPAKEMEMGDERVLCEACEEKEAVYDSFCRDCAHPDDVEWHEYDPGEDF